jgi:hypothetical protein
VPNVSIGSAVAGHSASLQLYGQTQEVRIEGASRTHAATKEQQSAQSSNDFLTVCIGKSLEISANNARSWKATTNAQFRAFKAATQV